MREILICTVGTSLINNISRESDSTLYKYLKDQNPKGLSLELGKIPPDNHICGAEINSIHSIIHSGYLNRQTSLKLLVSDTDEGRFTGDILSFYYKNNKNPDKFNNADFKVVEGLSDVDVVRFKNHGLRNLVRLIGRVVKTYDSQRILINATGGYKAQISFAGMIGQALEIPVCYMFEKFSEVIQLPPQPISLDLSFWLENVDTFFELDDGITLKEELERDEPRFSVLIVSPGNEQHFFQRQPISL
jgi:putative CRISPR-associated protein (TIGR02619 family)